MTASHSIEFDLAAMRVRYIEPRRWTEMGLDYDGNANDWFIRPETLTWWQRTSQPLPGAEPPRAMAASALPDRAPVRDDEREIVLQRTIEQARSRHSMWLNIAGRTPDPRPPHWKAPPVNATYVDGEDAELAAMAAAFGANERGPRPDIVATFTREDAASILERIEQALSRIEPMASAGWDPAQSIARQLHWCRAALRGEAVEPAPGPFSMGLIATREFDMYGSDPDLARLINEIQSAMQR